jgi:hypothetical protein
LERCRVKARLDACIGPLLDRIKPHLDNQADRERLVLVNERLDEDSISSQWPMSRDPSPRFFFMMLVKGSRFGVQKHSRRIDNPVLPVVTDYDGDPLYVPLMILDETRVRLKGRIAIPTIESGNIDQQPNLPALRDHWVDLLREDMEISFRKFPQRNNFQHAWTSPQS